MKKTNSQNFSEPYRTMGFNVVKAPKNTSEGQPKATQIKSSGDLRGGKNK